MGMRTLSPSHGTWILKSRTFFEHLQFDEHYCCRQRLQSGRRNMVDKRTTDSSETAHPLIKKALASKPPIAELIGFEVEEIRDGRARSGCCSRGRNTPIRWARSTAGSCATWRMRLWAWLSRLRWRPRNPLP